MKKAASLIIGLLMLMTAQVAAANPTRLVNVGNVDFGNAVKVEATKDKAGNPEYILRARDGEIRRTLYVSSVVKKPNAAFRANVLLQQSVDVRNKSAGQTLIDKEDAKQIVLPQGYDAATALSRSSLKFIVMDFGLVLLQGRLEAREIRWACADCDRQYWSPVVKKILEAAIVP